MNLQDFLWISLDQGFLSINMEPPIAIGQRSIDFTWGKRPGYLASGYFDKYSSSGLDGMSGITITNSGLGQLNVAINSVDTSGLPYGVYFYRCRFTDPPAITIAEGNILLEP